MIDLHKPDDSRLTAKYIKMGVEEWYTEVYKRISCGADTMMTNNERYRQPRFCANCGAAFTREENDERSM